MFDKIDIGNYSFSIDEIEYGAKFEFLMIEFDLKNKSDSIFIIQDSVLNMIEQHRTRIEELVNIDISAVLSRIIIEEKRIYYDVVFIFRNPIGIYGNYIFQMAERLRVINSHTNELINVNYIPYCEFKDTFFHYLRYGFPNKEELKYAIIKYECKCGKEIWEFWNYNLLSIVSCSNEIVDMDNLSVCENCYSSQIKETLTTRKKGKFYNYFCEEYDCFHKTDCKYQSKCLFSQYVNPQRYFEDLESFYEEEPNEIIIPKWLFLVNMLMFAHYGVLYSISNDAVSLFKSN